jgi:hypothetical protein
MTIPAAAAKKVNTTGRKRLLFKVAIWLVLGLAAYQVLWQHWLAGVAVPDYDVDKITGRTRIRRRPDELVKRDHLLGRDVAT